MIFVGNFSWDKQEGCWFETDEVNEFFSIYLILLVMLGPGVYSAFNRNEYQKQKIMFLGSRVPPVHRDDNFHLWADCLDNVEFLTSHNPIGLHSLLWGEL
jgi:hypothetical protein